MMGRTKMPAGIKPAKSKGKVKAKGYAAGGRVSTAAPANLTTPLNKGGRAKKKAC